MAITGRLAVVSGHDHHEYKAAALLGISNEEEFADEFGLSVRCQTGVISRLLRGCRDDPWRAFLETVWVHGAGREKTENTDEGLH